MPAKPNYILKGGALIHPAGTSKFYTNAIPDDVAEDYLAQFPLELNKFASYPEDWQERVARRIAQKEAPAELNTAHVSDEVVAKLQEDLRVASEAKKKAEADNEVLKKENDDLKEKNEALTEQLRLIEEQVSADTESGEDAPSDEIVNELQMELASVKEELEALKTENATLKNDNRALKAANTRLKNNGSKDAE